MSDRLLTNIFEPQKRSMLEVCVCLGPLVLPGLYCIITNAHSTPLYSPEYGSAIFGAAVLLSIWAFVLWPNQYISGNGAGAAHVAMCGRGLEKMKVGNVLYPTARHNLPVSSVSYLCGLPSRCNMYSLWEQTKGIWLETNHCTHFCISQL